MNFDLVMPRRRNGGGGGDMLANIIFLVHFHNEEILKVSIYFGVENKSCIKVDRSPACTLQP
jgi:hypothetical protein